jgi:hypothetical protein
MKSKTVVYKLLPGVILLLVTAVILFSCRPGQKPPATGGTPTETLKKGVILVDYRDQNKVDVFIDGDVFTSYIYPGELAKPVLFPVRSAKGTVITRGYPLKPREGERIDHPHQVGVWFAFEDVNGSNFWKGIDARILHRGVKRAESREALGVLEIAADWQIKAEDGTWHTLLQEKTIFEFSGDENTRTIERITQLTAQEDEIIFTDIKDGLLGIRLARELELPSDEAHILIAADGEPGEEPVLDTEGINGRYLNSEGIEGYEVWGKRADWVRLSSRIDDEEIAVTVFDHPGNFGFPSYWHARDYGLLAVNNLGARAFDENAEAVSVRLQPGESTTFRHRIYITSGELVDARALDAVSEEFRNK